MHDSYKILARKKNKRSKFTDIVIESEDLESMTMSVNLSQLIVNDSRSLLYTYISNASNISYIHIDGSVQDCSIFIANALEMLQACINPSIYPVIHPG